MPEWPIKTSNLGFLTKRGRLRLLLDNLSIADETCWLSACGGSKQHPAIKHGYGCCWEFPPPHTNFLFLRPTHHLFTVAMAWFNGLNAVSRVKAVSKEAELMWQKIFRSVCRIIYIVSTKIIYSSSGLMFHLVYKEISIPSYSDKLLKSHFNMFIGSIDDLLSYSLISSYERFIKQETQFLWIRQYKGCGILVQE